MFEEMNGTLMFEETNERWGFCEPCEGWVISGHWGAEHNERCPNCNQIPALIERRMGSGYAVEVMLLLPDDAVEPAF